VDSTRLRAWRLLQGLSYDDAAALVGISPAYWRMVERGAVPSAAVAARFEHAFGEPVSALLKAASVRALPVLREHAAP
jgi:transcriptional regulator with XRE-family HTH domain